MFYDLLSFVFYQMTILSLFLLLFPYSVPVRCSVTILLCFKSTVLLNKWISGLRWDWNNSTVSTHLQSAWSCLRKPHLWYGKAECDCFQLLCALDSSSRILFKCTFWFHSSRWSLRVCIFNILQVLTVLLVPLRNKGTQQIFHELQFKPVESELSHGSQTATTKSHNISRSHRYQSPERGSEEIGGVGDAVSDKLWE